MYKWEIKTVEGVSDKHLNADAPRGWELFALIKGQYSNTMITAYRRKRWFWQKGSK